MPLFPKRFKWIKQHDSKQCGAACLSMICHHHGIGHSQEYLNELCSTGIEGVSMYSLSKGAKKIGLTTNTVAVTTDELTQLHLPCILHWNQKHFVVLTSISKNTDLFSIADPSKGMIKYRREDFESHWLSIRETTSNGIAMQLSPTELFFTTSEPKGIIRRRPLDIIGKYLKVHVKYLVYVLLCLFIGSILQLLMPFLTQGIVDLGIAHQDIGLIWLILLGEFMIVVGKTTTDFIRRWLLLHISIRMNISFISDFFGKLLKLPMPFFETKLIGDLIQRMSDHTRVQNFLTGQFLNIFFTFLSFLIFGCVLLIYDKAIFCIFILGSCCYAIWITIFLTRRKTLDYELFERQAIGQNMTYQFVSYMQEIKLQGCEQRRRREWEESQTAIYRVQMKAMKLQQTQEAGSIFINEVKNILITVLAATAVIKGQMTLGAMVAVQYIIGQLNSPVERFMAFIYSLQDVKISLDRINEIHQGRNEEEATNNHTSYNATKSIGIRAIDFKYDPHAIEMTLENVSLEIPEGKVTAIVGASGSGKTTLLKLILGYYPVINGCIEVAGRKIPDYNPRWWRSRCGVVMQDGVIFSESIARNIAVDDGPIDVERLEEAARIAHIHEYILGLPLRYNTKIGRDGVGLSQGQKQRILIARAVYKNPDFIFLDEATNALDAKNERLIVEDLEGFYQGRTVVVVAHRLSTVKNADQIVVLDHGRVAETGTHLSLIAQRGVYYNLVKNQLELGN